MSVRVGTNTESRIQQSFNLSGLCFCVCVCVGGCVFLFLFVPFDVVIFLHGEYSVHDQMDSMADYSVYLGEITLKVLCNLNNIYLEKCFPHILNNSNTLLNISLKLKAQG